MRLLAAIALLTVAGVATTLMPGAQAAREFTVRVHGKDNLWLAGGNPAPGSFPGTKPPSLDIPNNATAVTVINATGLVACCGGAPDVPPDGGASPTSIAPTTGSIGPYQGPSNLPLVGVFLKGQATGNVPDDFNRDDDGQFRTASPRLKQPFFIGDGDTPGGATQTYRIPNGAQKLFLGVADSFGFNGPPDYYEDNNGSFRVRVRFETGGGGGGGGGGLDSLPPPELGETANVGPVKGDVLIGIRDNAARAAQKGIRFVPLTEAAPDPDRIVPRHPRRHRCAQDGAQRRRRRAARQVRRRPVPGAPVAQAERERADGAAPQRLGRRVQAMRREQPRGRGTLAPHGQATAREREGPLPHARPALGGDRARNALGDGGSLRRDADHGEAGTVVVRDFRLKESITVTAGKSYLARAPD